MYRFTFLFFMLFTFTLNEVIINVFRPGSNRTIRVFEGMNMNINNTENDTYDVYLIGGIKAKDKQFPYQVSLIQKSIADFFCGGSIITSKHVITAAHCFCEGEHAKEAHDMQIGVGDLAYQGHNTTMYDVQRSACHPEYKAMEKFHDIAMLCIKDEFQYNDKVKFIKLLVGGFGELGEVVSGLTVQITGWGSDRFEDPEASPHLKFINTETISLDKCRELLGNTSMEKYVKEWNVCTYHPAQQRTCVGDSGGPVVYQNQLLAVVSWSRRCDDHRPGVHTSIAHHNAWIQAECAKDKLMYWIGN